MKKTIFFLLLLPLTSNISIAQTFQHGLVIPDQLTDEYEICCIYLPDDGFAVYDSPNGSKTGELTRKDNNRWSQGSYQLFYHPSDASDSLSIDLSNLQEIGYEIWALTFFERRQGFIRIIN